MRVSPYLLKRARKAAGLSQRELAERIADDFDLGVGAPALKTRIARLETGAVLTVDEEFGYALREELELGDDRFALWSGERWRWARRQGSGDYQYAAPVGMRYPSWGSPEEALEGRDVLARTAPGALAGTELVEATPDHELWQMGDDYFDEFIGRREDDDVSRPILWRRLPVLRLSDPDEDELSELGLFHSAAHAADEEAREAARATLAGRAERDEMIVPPNPVELLCLARRRMRSGLQPGYAKTLETASADLLERWQREADVLAVVAEATCAGCR